MPSRECTSTPGKSKLSGKVIKRGDLKKSKEGEKNHLNRRIADFRRGTTDTSDARRLMGKSKERQRGDAEKRPG